MVDKEKNNFGRKLSYKLASPGWMIFIFLIGAALLTWLGALNSAPWAFMDLLIVLIFVYLIESKIKRDSMTDEEIIAADKNIKEVR